MAKKKITAYFTVSVLLLIATLLLITLCLRRSPFAVSDEKLEEVELISEESFGGWNMNYAERYERIEELREKNSEFTSADFGGDFLEMPTDKYPSPSYYPTGGQHPFVFFTKEDIDDIRTLLMGDEPEFENLRKQFWNYANAQNFTGIFPEVVGKKTGEVYRYDTKIIAQIEAKALAYILTGDEIYGYEAIVGVKNASLTLKFTKDIHTDTYHGASHMMIEVAKVYDWCYDLLNDSDKSQLIAAVSNLFAPQLEKGMNFPPSGMNGISGHGTGPQFQRDWLTVSLAFYDEVPSWWQYVGGRYFNEYVPPIDYSAEGGYASQGTITYGGLKLFLKYWSAWIIKNATGEYPFSEDLTLSTYYLLQHIQPNDLYFQTGDGERRPDGAVRSKVANYMFIAAMLSGDASIGAMAKHLSKNYTSFSYDFTEEYTVCDVLIWTALGPEIKEEAKENLDLIQYFPHPSGTMSARSSWGSDGAAVLMRFDEMTMGNHDAYDHGTFQIYYKGLLAGVSGSYKKYDSNVHRYYTQATISHNGLLVFDPRYSDSEPRWTCTKSHEHSLTTCSISNAGKYFYSGGQSYRGEPGTMQNWLGGRYEMAEVYGRDMGYKSNGSAEFAYIAGDITKSYFAASVKYVGRKMLTIFTGDETYPMLFFTYDQITSAAGGENFTKTFLLHTVKEPEIDQTNLTAVITEGEGRLFLHSVTGAQKIEKIGGPGKAFWINGKNCVDTSAKTDNAENIWGRLELTTSGNLSDNLLTAMYVSDATNDKPLDVSKIQSADVDGVLVKNNFVIFTKTVNKLQQNESFAFDTEGIGLYEYYIAGLEEGVWNVKIDGISVAYSYSDKESGMIKFTAPAGRVNVSPVIKATSANLMKEELLTASLEDYEICEINSSYSDSQISLSDRADISLALLTDKKFILNYYTRKEYFEIR